MSEVEHNKGRLILVSSNPEEFAEQYVTKKHRVYDTKLEQLMDEGFEDNLEVINGKVYEVEWEIRGDIDLEFADVSKNEDGSIDFHTLHYNGGAYWTEIVSECLNEQE